MSIDTKGMGQIERYILDGGRPETEPEPETEGHQRRIQILTVPVIYTSIKQTYRGLLLLERQGTGRLSVECIGGC